MSNNKTNNGRSDRTQRSVGLYARLVRGAHTTPWRLVGCASVRSGGVVPTFTRRAAMLAPSWDAGVCVPSSGEPCVEFGVGNHPARLKSLGLRPIVIHRSLHIVVSGGPRAVRSGWPKL